MASAHNAQASRVLVNHGAPVRLQYPHPVAGCLALRTLVHAIAAFRACSASLVVLILTWSCLCEVNSIITPNLKDRATQSGPFHLPGGGLATSLQAAPAHRAPREAYARVEVSTYSCRFLLGCGRRLPQQPHQYDPGHGPVESACQYPAQAPD